MVNNMQGIKKAVIGKTYGQAREWLHTEIAKCEEVKSNNNLVNSANNQRRKDLQRVLDLVNEPILLH